ncbi:hypothetical protein Tco_1002012 [Tanacetum coccineum]|uniref:Uncharacterized protein n=1 Tax=Tanacetum coccineum TaxID=301880 RepID=A0ABQ5F5Z3_9ASTR
MASLDYRLNPLYAIKECSSCGALYTADFCCSKGGLEDKILVPKPPQNCATCGDPVDGLYCRPCAFVRKCLNEDCGGPHETFQCQPMNYYEPNPCYNSNYSGFDQTQPPQYTVNHTIFNTQNEFLNSQNKLMEQMTSICDMVGQIMQKKEEEKRIAEEQAAKDRYWKIPICYDDDEDYTIAITPVLSTKEPVDSLIMEDEHLDTIPATESDEVIKSSVENLVQIPSESKGISDGGCDVPLCDNPTPLEAFKEHSETIVDSNNDSTSSDDDYPYGEDIDYVDASPPDAEIVSLEVVESVIPEVGGVDTDILLTIKDDITNIESLNDNPTPDRVLKSPSLVLISVTDSDSFFEESDTFLSHLDNSLPKFETFSDHTKETRSGSTTTHANNSLPSMTHFFFSPPPEPPDVEICLNFEPDTVVINNFDELNIDESFDPGGGKIVVSQNVEDDDSFTFVIRTFLPFLTYPADSTLLLSTRNEDTIFDPGIST